MTLFVEKTFEKLNSKGLLPPHFCELLQEGEGLIDGAWIFLKGLPQLRTS